MSGVVFCERLFVHPYVRGNQVGLRLLREIRSVYAASKALIMFKAVPDDLEEGQAHSTKLSEYYQSDAILGMQPVTSAALPGWLAGQCKPFPVNDHDQVAISLNTRGEWEEITELGLDE